MALNDFENIIDPKILDRGFDYYENERIEEINQIEKAEFSATVIGPEEYTVYLKLSSDLEIHAHSCDCPYDWGNYCKHEVAVLYHMQGHKLYENQLEENVFHKLKKDLNKLTKQELITVIFNLSKKKKSIKEGVMGALGHE
ncbi:MAG: SWIM zinc finger family protein [Marinirhabdus sp.]